MRYDVGVIGGGVIGLSCAWRLAQRGARVAVFEKGETGREASWAAAGMLAAQCEAAHHPPSSGDRQQHVARFELCLRSREMYPDFLLDLQTSTDIEVEASLKAPAPGDRRKPGILYVATAADDPAPAAFVDQRHQGHRVEQSNFSGHEAFWLPDEGQVENRHLTATLRVAAEVAGVTIYENAAVELTPGSGTEQRIALHTNLEVDCERILLCAGAWSSESLNTASSELNTAVRPLAGQMLSVRAEHLLDHIIYSSDCYLVPRRDGRLLIGATMEDHGFNKYVTLEATQRLLQRAFELMPELAKLPLENQWVGLRPVSADGLPLLGRTTYENLFIATGHGRNGILLTPITAVMMADTILEGIEIPADFSPERFTPALCASN